MDFVIGLVIGLIIGFLLRWVLDPLFISTQSTRGDERDQLGELADAEPYPRGSIESGQTITRIILRDRDELSQIKGIGPVFANRLNQAGIYTFRQLASTTPARLLQISLAEDWQAIDVNSWINQARHLAIDTTRVAGL